MRALVQRVTEASVEVVDGESGEPARAAERGGHVVGRIGPGILALVGVTHTDTPAEARWLAAKLWNLRIFDDEAGVMNRSVADTGGSVLVVSQFTLYGDASGGRRPGWSAAARPEQAEPLVQAVVDELVRLGAPVATGRFRAAMRVALVNDGPVTLMVETPPGGSPRS